VPFPEHRPAPARAAVRGYAGSGCWRASGIVSVGLRCPPRPRQCRGSRCAAIMVEPSGVTQRFARERIGRPAPDVSGRSRRLQRTPRCAPKVRCTRIYGAPRPWRAGGCLGIIFYSRGAEAGVHEVAAPRGQATVPEVVTAHPCPVLVAIAGARRLHLAAVRSPAGISSPRAASRCRVRCGCAG
jgi:hypothetical protein